MDFSVIIPAYNCGNTIIKTVESIEAVEIDKIEIILVDDGSTDSTREKCKMLVDRFPNVKYYYQKNSGVSAARNNGINHAEGRYILLWDSDDIARTDLLRTCMIKALNQDADMLIFGMELNNTFNGKLLYIHTWQCDKEERFNKYGYSEKLTYLFDINYLSSGCNKILKRSICQKISFNTAKKVFEDLLYVLDYLGYCDSICIMPDLAYVYQIELSKKKSSRVKCIDNLNEYMKEFQYSVLKLEANLDLQLPELRNRIAIVYEWILIEKLECCTYRDLKKLDPKKMRLTLFNETYCVKSRINNLYFQKRFVLLRSLCLYRHFRSQLSRRIKSLLA